MPRSSAFALPLLALSMVTQTAAAASEVPATTTATQARQASATPARPPYDSAFSTYRPYREQELLQWREANALVESIGGWKAYAREAQSTASTPADGAASTPAIAAPARVDKDPAK